MFRRIATVLLCACALTVALAARWGVGLRDDLAAAVFVAAYVVAVGVVRFRRYLAPRRAPGGTVNGHMGEDVENALVP